MAQNIQERETVILLLCVGRAELERLVPTQSPGGSISHRQPWRIVFDKSFFLFHLDRTNEARKSGSNGGNSLRLSHPVFLAPKEKHWAGDLLKFVLRGLFAPVHSKILLGCGEVVGSKLLCVHSLAKVVDVARAGSRWLMGNNFL